MPEHKKHHYVPRFYLKNFSHAGEGNFLSLLNLKRQRFVAEASLYGQCYRNYYYGVAPDLEFLLRDIEGCASNILRAVISNDLTPEYGSRRHKDLLTFIYAQIVRTVAADERVNAEVSARFSFLFGLLLDPETSRLSPSIRWRGATTIPVVRGVLESPLLHDLEFKILINDTSEKFITSDDPLVRFNQFFQSALVRHDAPTDRGLEIYLPISPTRAVLLYDGYVYRVGGFAHDNQSIHINEPDARELNKLAVLNARENLYFHDASLIDRVTTLVEEVSEVRARQGRRKAEIRIRELPDGDARALMEKTPSAFLHRTHLRCVSSRRGRERNAKPGMRDRAWAKIIVDFANVAPRLLSEDANIDKQFMRFIREHSLASLVARPTWANEARLSRIILGLVDEGDERLSPPN